MRKLRVLDVVALLEDLPEDGLLRGQVGTLVEALAPGVFEVEFSDATGRAYAILAVREEQVLRLLHEPMTPVQSWVTEPAKAASP